MANPYDPQKIASKYSKRSVRAFPVAIWVIVALCVAYMGHVEYEFDRESPGSPRMSLLITEGAVLTFAVCVVLFVILFKWLFAKS